MCSALLPPEGPVRPSTRMKCEEIPKSATSGTRSSCPYMLRIDWLRPAATHAFSRSSTPSARPQPTRCSV